MNFLNHRQKTQGHVLPMPDGLEDLMADISREVLRCQPSIDCTYKFIADYLEAMVTTRDKHQMAMEVINEAILKTDEVYSQFIKCNIPNDKTDKFLDVMEMTFRRFVDQKRQKSQDTRFIKFHADDMLEELIRKCDLTKVEILRSRPAIQWAYRKFVKTYLQAIEGTLDTEDLYFDTEKIVVSNRELNEMHESAIKIQKVFRGYRTRKSMQENQTLKFKMVSSSSEDSSFTSSFKEFVTSRQEEMTKAAIKIQASFKGFYVRKKQNELYKKKVSLMPPTQGHMSPLKTSSHKNFKESFKQLISEEKFQELAETSLEGNNNNNVVEDQDLKEAAIKIQAHFKGYRVRQEMSHKSKVDKNNPTPEEQSSQNPDPDVSSKHFEDFKPKEGPSFE